ncbi:Sensor kinase CckA [Fundidesulfovibrio magnetotacticus]|uniref:histidine kinase n=1 Tax=Fundidesulfovibrio magnetotacticus TaxID=2730080 RepID=A0A6V8LUE3_9BACT|nr:ATP-binding protein [Fundidesulfovibrio magnetotacticus]GFK93257.1 Sensor kinase CckA [Fundidesulfovibrio magnetotacticus]
MEAHGSTTASRRTLARALTLVVLAALIPATIMLVLTGLEQRDIARRDALETAQGLARSLAALHKASAGEARAMLSALARTNIVQTRDLPNCAEVFAGILADNPQLTNVFLADAPGRAVASGLAPFTGTDVSDRAYFQRAMASGHFSAGDHIHGRSSGLPIQVFAMPLKAPDGRPDAVLVLSYKLSMYERFLEGYPMPSSARVAFIDSKGVRMLAFPTEPDRTVGTAVSPAVWGRIRTAQSDQGWFSDRRTGGAPGLFVFSRLRLEGDREPFVSVAVSFSNEDIFGRAERNLARNLLLTALAGLLALAVSRRLGRRAILDGVEGLRAAAARLGEGELEARADEARGCLEFRELAGRFNAMAQALQRRQDEVTRSARDLSAMRNLLANLLESMPSAVIGMDARERITHWNRGAKKLTGLEPGQALGRTLTEVFPWLAQRVDHVERGPRDVAPLELTASALPGAEGTRYMDILASPLVANGVDGAVVRVDDVTERVRLEALLIQSEKMNSIGSLAGGMAHEINNPLSGILQAVQIIQRRLDPSAEANRAAALASGADLEILRDYLQRRGIFTFLDTVRESGERAARIVRNMLGFIRKSASARVPVSLPELADKTIEIAATDYDLKKKYDFRSIEIVREYAPDMPLVHCSASDLEQVVYNLLVNAAQAMASRDAPPAPPRLVVRVHAADGMGVLEIEDNGPGMEESVRLRVFEPLFSTKPPGEGTGLGLAVAWFIVVNSHGGDIRAESSPGRGARFVVRLPLAGPEHAESGAPLTPARG